MRVECTHHIGEGFEAHVGHGVLFRHDKYLLQHLGQPQPTFFAVNSYVSADGTQQSADEIEQGGLAGAVLAKQSIDAAGIQTQAEVTEHLVLAALIVETEVSYFNHIFSIIKTWAY